MELDYLLVLRDLVKVGSRYLTLPCLVSVSQYGQSITF